jgi:hypothetical protein
MATLVARPGDAQALKTSIAAAFANLSIDIKQVADGQGPTNLFGTPSLCLSTPDGVSLSEPNAAALYVLGGYLVLLILTGCNLLNVRSSREQQAHSS